MHLVLGEWCTFMSADSFFTLGLFRAETVLGARSLHLRCLVFKLLLQSPVIDQKAANGAVQEADC